MGAGWQDYPAALRGVNRGNPLVLELPPHPV